MNILLTGATGMIGTALQDALADHQLWCLVRRDPAAGEIRHGTAIRSVEDIDGQIDAVINLAGENIGARRWSRARKQALRDSRIAFTRDLIQALEQAGQSPQVWINASAVGYYGDRPGEVISEDTPPGDDFAASLCMDWERAAAANPATRTVIFRLGVVLGEGGVLGKMLLPFRCGLGVVMGPGGQYMPWVAIEDVCQVIRQALEDGRFSGPINLVAPQAVSQREFSSALAHAVRRPLLFRLPTPIVRLLMGEMSMLLLADQRVDPKRLTSLGFHFQEPKISDALEQAVS